MKTVEQILRLPNAVKALGLAIELMEINMEALLEASQMDELGIMDTYHTYEIHHNTLVSLIKSLAQEKIEVLQQILKDTEEQMFNLDMADRWEAVDYAHYDTLSERIKNIKVDITNLQTTADMYELK